jgi:hypothetical protein
LLNFLVRQKPRERFVVKVDRINPVTERVAEGASKSGNRCHAHPDRQEKRLSEIDTPRRDPKGIIFVNPEDGTPESFIRADNPRGDKA